jgi:outer membrane protein TolC
MGMSRVLLVLALIPLGATEQSIALSDESENRTSLSLPQITLRVKESSELIQAQKLKSQGVLAQGKQASAWQNPSITAEIGRLRDTLNSDMTYDFRLTQPFRFPGKSGTQASVFEKQSQMMKVEGEDLSSSLTLEATYFAYAYTIAELKSSQITSRIRRMSLMRTYMRAQAYASPAKVIQRNIVNNQLLALQKHLNSAMSQTESSWQKLNIYLNQKEKVKVITPWLANLKDIDREAFFTKVLSGNRRLKAKTLELASAEAEVSYQKQVPLPDVSLSAFYRKEALEKPGANEFYGGAVTVPIPVLNANRSGVEAAEKKLEAMRAEQKYLEREINQQARAAYAEYTQKKKLLDTFDESQIPTIERQMLYADRELKLGRIDLLSYLELELKTHEAVNSYYDTQLELVRVISQMIYLMGDSTEYKGNLYVFQNN